MSEEEALDLSMPSHDRSAERSGLPNDEPESPVSLGTTEHSNDSSANGESDESGDSHVDDETDRLSPYTTMVDSPTEVTIYSPGGSIISSPHHSPRKDDHVFKRPFDVSSSRSTVAKTRPDPSAQASAEGIMSSTEHSSLSSPLPPHSPLQDNPTDQEQSSVSPSRTVVNTESDAKAKFLEKLISLLHTPKYEPVPRQPGPVTSAPLPVPREPGPVTSAPLPVPREPGPVTSAPLPVPREPGPVPSVPLPAPRESGPVPSVLLPAPKESGPVPSVPLPAPRESGPVPSVPLPIPREPGPVPSVPLPVPREPGPVPSVPLPVPREPGPVPPAPLPVPRRIGPAPAVPLPAPRQPGPSVQTSPVHRNVKTHLTTGERQPDAIITPRPYNPYPNIPLSMISHNFLLPTQPGPSVQTAPSPRDVETNRLIMERQSYGFNAPRPFNPYANIPPIMFSHNLFPTQPGPSVQTAPAPRDFGETSRLIGERQSYRINAPRPFNPYANIPPSMFSHNLFPTQPGPSIQTAPAPRDIEDTSMLIEERQSDGINAPRPFNLYPNIPLSMVSHSMMHPAAALLGMYRSSMMVGTSGIVTPAPGSFSPFISASPASLPSLHLPPQSPMRPRFAVPRRRRGKQGNSSASSETCASSSTTVKNSSVRGETSCASSSTTVKNSSVSGETSCASSSTTVKNSSVSGETSCASSSTTVRNSSVRSETSCASSSTTVRNAIEGEVNNADSDNDAEMDTESPSPRDDSASGFDETHDPSSSNVLKDKAYYEKRKKNNEAARKSRAISRQRAEETALRLVELERDHMELTASVDVYKREVARLQHIYAMQMLRRQNEEDNEEDNAEERRENDEDKEEERRQNAEDNDESGNTT